MTVKYVTHLLETGDVMVTGHLEDVLTVKGQRVSRVGAVEGQEQQNPPAVHVNFEIVKTGEHPTTPDMLGLILSPSDALELGMLLVAMAIEDKTTAEVGEIKEHLSRLVTDLQHTVQVSR
jgi:hypothetical protein